MEPSGRNRSQPVANVRPRERLEQAQTVAAGCDWLPKEAHGKEGVEVRVRQRALQKRRTAASFCSSGVADSARCGGYGGVAHGASQPRARTDTNLSSRSRSLALSRCRRTDRLPNDPVN